MLVNAKFMRRLKDCAKSIYTLYTGKNSSFQRRFYYVWVISKSLLLWLNAQYPKRRLAVILRVPCMNLQTTTQGRALGALTRCRLSTSVAAPLWPSRGGKAPPLQHPPAAAVRKLLHVAYHIPPVPLPPRWPAQRAPNLAARACLAPAEYRTTGT